MSELAKLPAGWGEIARHRAGQDNPTLLVPADFRPAVAVLWMTNAHLLPSALPLCASLRIDAERGLTAGDLELIVKRLTVAEARAKHRFASDLLADLARLVAEAVAKRRAADEATVRRDEAEAFAGAKLAADLFRID